MLKKLLMAGGGLVVFLVVLYMGLNSMYNKNTAPAEGILDAIQASARNYDNQVQAGTFDYDREQSILNTKIRAYEQLTQWAIRPHVKSRYDGVVSEAGRALTDAQRMELSMHETQQEGEDRAAAAMAEMLENQRRAAEQGP